MVAKVKTTLKGTLREVSLPQPHLQPHSTGSLLLLLSDLSCDYLVQVISLNSLLLHMPQSLSLSLFHSFPTFYFVGENYNHELFFHYCPFPCFSFLNGWWLERLVFYFYLFLYRHKTFPLPFFLHKHIYKWHFPYLSFSLFFLLSRIWPIW